jgi:hypothetical protein
VERSTERFFADAEFAEYGGRQQRRVWRPGVGVLADGKCERTWAHLSAGATLVDGGAWWSAPLGCFIVGLKELPENDTRPLAHRHIFFGHCYKGQYGWRELLHRFVTGGGALLDMEFLNDERGARHVAATWLPGQLP